MQKEYIQSAYVVNLRKSSMLHSSIMSWLSDFLMSHLLQIIFVSAAKIGDNTTNIYTAIFPSIFILGHMKLNIYI